MLTEKWDKGPPVVAQKAVRWVDAQARYSTPSTSTNLTAMKCCCWGSYMGETMLRAWPGAPGRIVHSLRKHERAH
jgi:hypothetical protein